MSNKFAVGGVLSLLLVATSLPATVSVSQEQPKWFVLRHQKGDYCWTQLLIQVMGNYRFQHALKAAGPYNTEEEALAEKKNSKGVVRVGDEEIVAIWMTHGVKSCNVGIAVGTLFILPLGRKYNK